MTAFETILSEIGTLAVPALFNIYFAAAAIPLGFVLAIFLALGKASANPIVNALSRGYIYFFRGSPFFIQLFAFYSLMLSLNLSLWKPLGIDGFVLHPLFLGPAILRPLEHGADLVLHAATKFLSGHGDAVSGVVSGRKALIDPIRKQTDTLGQAANPFASFLVMRGVRTLALRTAAASANAARIAAFLEASPKVEWVRYPSLDSHPDRAVARRLLGDVGGAMVTFQPRGGLDGMAAFTDHLALCDIGVSLGDVHTLVYPRPKDGGIIRLSIGCEDVEDLIADFELGLSFVR